MMGALAEFFIFLRLTKASGFFAGPFLSLQVVSFYDTTFVTYDDREVIRKKGHFQLAKHVMSSDGAAELKWTEAIPMSTC